MANPLYSNYTLNDFDKFDCVKLSMSIYLILLFVLRGYIVFFLTVTNMRDQVGIIKWVYPDPLMFYLSLVSGVIGLFVAIVLILRRPDAKEWVKVCWKYCRVLLIIALVFDLVISALGYFYWQLSSVMWLIIQMLLVAFAIFLCFSNKRFAINLQEFPEKLSEE